MTPVKLDDYVKQCQQEIIPLVEKTFPDLAADMIFVVDSFEKGTLDDPASPSSTIYLDDRLWASKGGRLQLLLETSLPLPSEMLGVDGTRHCVGIWVHPVSWWRQLRRFLDTRAEAGTPLPWEEITIEQFHDVHNVVVLRDPRGTWGFLREATGPELYPGWLWDKHLICGLHDLFMNLRQCQRALTAGRTIDARIMLGDMTADVIRLGFYVHRQYYPSPPHLRAAFEQLPAPASEVLRYIDAAVTAADPAERLAAMTAARDVYVRHIVETSRLPMLNLAVPDLGLGDLGDWEAKCQELLWARRCEGWSDPRWHNYISRCKKEAAQDGHPNYMWIYSLWDMKERLPHI